MMVVVIMLSVVLVATILILGFRVCDLADSVAYLARRLASTEEMVYQLSRNYCECCSKRHETKEEAK